MPFGRAEESDKSRKRPVRSKKIGMNFLSSIDALPNRFFYKPSIQKLEFIESFCKRIKKMAGVGSFVAWEMGDVDENDNGSSTNCPLKCYNGGTCEVRAATNEYYCKCPHLGNGGMMGVHCEIPFLECADNDGDFSWRCLNGGMCSNSTDEICHCLDEFGGPSCEIFVGPSDFIATTGFFEGEGPFSVEAIAVISTLSIVLSFVCFMTGFHVGRGKREPVDFDNDLDLNLDLESEEYVDVGGYELEGNTQTLEPPELPKDAEIM